LKSLVKVVAVSILVFALGLHWALLQSVAWTGMLISYSRNASLRSAVTRTFDGEHPCPLCKAVKKGRAEEKKQAQEQLKPGSKLDFGLVWHAAQFRFDSARAPAVAGEFRALARAESPPKPRPRSAVKDDSARG
jgi:hypothetical protein